MKTLSRHISRMALLALLAFGALACSDNLDTLPLDSRIQTWNNISGADSTFQGLLAKCYSGLAVGGQSANDGDADISSINGGFSSYLRQYWCAQQLTTDEAIAAWNDGSLRDYHDLDFVNANEFIAALYYRVNIQIAFCNNLIRLAKGKSQYEAYSNEARLLRALSYWHMLDLFRTGPFVTENDKVGFFFPRQATAQELFDYVESELKDLENKLPAPRANQYGRVDRAAAWMILAKLYLNAPVYINTSKNNECITYARKVVEGGYTLETNYKHLFLADNHLRRNEIILPICFDGMNTQTWGGTTYLISAAIGGSMNSSDYGIGGGWWGNRVTKEFVGKFADVTGATDKRAIFHTDGQSLEINDIFSFTQGYAVGKYKNITSTGQRGSSGTFPDTDFPMFRLSDAYLMLAEAVVRGGQGSSRAEALELINMIRRRAHQVDLNTPSTIDITDAEMTLSYIINERARELYWEGHRRTDLVRFNLLTSNDYLWAWKGGIKEGKAVDTKYNTLPIPAADINANPNLTQINGW